MSFLKIQQFKKYQRRVNNRGTGLTVKYKWEPNVNILLIKPLQAEENV